MNTPHAVVVEDPDAQPPALLARALVQSGFWEALDAAQRYAGVTRDAIRILIKPDLEAFDAGAPTAVNPALVEALIDALHDRGYPRVDLCGTADSSFFWAENRDVAVLADQLGYQYVTPGGHSYDVIDLSEDLVPASFPEGGVLQGSGLGRAWLEATFRICFARNKTDEHEAYALCLNGLLGVLPLVDKDYYYRHRVSAGNAVCDLLRATPVHFAIIDASVSAHGSGGSRAPLALPTGCIIASSNPLLTDFVGALKMGLDPYASPLAATVYRTIHLPERYAIEGNLGPYPGWRNVQPVLIDSYRWHDLLPVAGRLLTPWLQTLNAELFPLKSVVDAKVNPTLSRFFAEPDRAPTALWLLILANYGVGALSQWLEAYRVLYDKDAIRRIQVPLGLDLDSYHEAQYAAIRDELDQLTALLADVPPATEGLRWREVDQATVFEFQRELPIPFDTFVERVDVARTIQFMNDYIGGVVVPTARDAHHRVVRQAERNLYLPQPNYLALYQGKLIDVSKIEVCDYASALHRMYWKTIKSENQSATYDDGVVTFSRTRGGTRVHILGRQLFTLPPFWQAIDLNLAPQLKATLVTHAYKTFFERTCANFEALVEGREIHIGRAWHAPSGPLDTEPLPAERLERIGGRLGERLQEMAAQSGLQWSAPDSGARTSARVDEDGFRHFEGKDRSVAPAGVPSSAAWLSLVGAVSDFFSGWSAAVAADVAHVGRVRDRTP